MIAGAWGGKGRQATVAARCSGGKRRQGRRIPSVSKASFERIGFIGEAHASREGKGERNS